MMGAFLSYGSQRNLHRARELARIMPQDLVDMAVSGKFSEEQLRNTAFLFAAIVGDALHEPFRPEPRRVHAANNNARRCR